MSGARRDSVRGEVRDDDLLVVADVGNTHTVLGVYRGDELTDSFRLSTDPERTSDELRALLAPLLATSGIEPRSVDGLIVSSVVPPMNPILASLGRSLFGAAPLFVEPGIKTGMPIRYDNPSEVGADRIVNAVAARAVYGAPLIVVDFGTATTFDYVNPAGEYAGGIIAPGLGISAEALFSQASRLYRVDLRKPEDLIGRTTAGAMQSGIFYGYLGLVDGILGRLQTELPDLATVVATGGLAELIAAESPAIQEVAPMLTLDGLRRIYRLNRRS